MGAYLKGALFRGITAIKSIIKFSSWHILIYQIKIVFTNNKALLLVKDIMHNSLPQFNILYHCVFYYSGMISSLIKHSLSFHTKYRLTWFLFCWSFFHCFKYDHCYEVNAMYQFTSSSCFIILMNNNANNKDRCMQKLGCENFLSLLLLTLSSPGSMKRCCSTSST